METRFPRVNLFPSIGDAFFIAIFLLLFAYDRTKLLGDCDTGYHIRAGEYILKTHSIPKSDIFSYHTPPIPWTAHEWLSEVVMAAVHAAFGLTGVVALSAALVSLTIALLFKIIKGYGTDILIAATTVSLVTVVSHLHWLARPHLFSLLLMVIFHYLLESWRRGLADRLYLLPAVMLLWVNLHGGFIGGFILLGAYLAGNLASLWSATAAGREAEKAKLRGLGIATAGCFLASLINPQGYHLLLFPFQLVSDSYIMDNVNEFKSPDFHNPLLLPFRLSLVLLMALLAISKKRLTTTELLLVLIFTNMALYSARHVQLFAVVTAPIMAGKMEEIGGAMSGRIADFFRERSRNLLLIDARSAPCLWPAAILGAVALTGWSGGWNHAFDPQIKPVAACDFLMKERVAGNMFNNDEMGDYIIYRAYPSYRVFFDGRNDMYGSAMVREYLEIVALKPGWRRLLEKYRITWIIFYTDTNLSRSLAQDRDWRLIFSDNVASIFVKNLPQYSELIQKHRTVRLATP